MGVFVWLCSCMCRLRVKGECGFHECILPLTRKKTTHAITVEQEAHPNRKRRKTEKEVMSGGKSGKGKDPTTDIGGICCALAANSDGSDGGHWVTSTC